MLMNIREELINRKLRGATVNVYVYPDMDYVIVPMGQSPTKEWFGFRNIDCLERGNIRVDSEETFMKKLSKSFKVGYDYINMGLKASPKDVEARFIKEGKENNFKNYCYLSLNILSSEEAIQINVMKNKDKKGMEWVGERDSKIVLPLNDSEKIYNCVKKFVNNVIK